MQRLWYCLIQLKKISVPVILNEEKARDGSGAGISNINLCTLSLKLQQYFCHVLINMSDFNSLKSIGIDEVTSCGPSHSGTCLQPSGITLFVLCRASLDQQPSWRQIIAVCRWASELPKTSSSRLGSTWLNSNGTAAPAQAARGAKSCTAPSHYSQTTPYARTAILVHETQQKAWVRCSSLLFPVDFRGGFVT